MATPARTVQLRNANDVIEAYLNWNTPQFSIISGKQLLFCYDDETPSMEEGEQMLRKWVTWIKNGGSAAIYTLAIYKNPKKEITNDTPYNGSVNFQLGEYSSYNSGGMAGSNDAGMKMVMDSINALQLQMQKLQAQLDEEDEEDEKEGKPDMLGQISDFISNPVIASVIGSLLPAGNKFLKQPPVQPNQPMQNEIGQVSRITGATDKDSQKRMADILKKLQMQIDNLPDVLEQLSKLAEMKPGQFKMYMGALMAMQL